MDKPLTAIKLHIIECCVITNALFTLHLCLDPTYPNQWTALAPWAKFTPHHASAVQDTTITAVELDVVSSCIITTSLSSFHSQRKRNQETCVTRLLWVPVSPPANKYPKIWVSRFVISPRDSRIISSSRNWVGVYFWLSKFIK